MRSLHLFFIALVLTTKAFAADSPNFYYGMMASESDRQAYTQVKQYNDQQLFHYWRMLLPRILFDCLKEKCVSGDSIELIKKIQHSAHFDQNSGRLFFANSSGQFSPRLSRDEKRYLAGYNFHPGPDLFKVTDSPALRTAMSSVGPGPIVINLDKVKNISIEMAFRLLLHEYGHQMGLRDNTHRYLDQLASQLSLFLNRRLKPVSFKNITITNHYYLLPGTMEKVEDGDLELYYYPHLVIQDGKHTIVLHQEIMRLLLKLERYQRIASVWLEGMRLHQVNEQFLSLKANLSQIAIDPNGGSMPLMGITGELDLALPIKKQNKKYHLDLDKNVRSVFMHIDNFKKYSRHRIKLSQVTIPNSVSAGERLLFSLDLEVKPGDQIEDVLVYFDKDRDYFELYPTQPMGELISLERLSETKYRANLELSIHPHFRSPTLTLDRVKITLKASDEEKRVYPKFRRQVKIRNSLPLITPYLEEQGIYATSVKFPATELKVLANRQFFPFRFFIPGGDNGIHFDLLYSGINGEILQNAVLAVEEQFHPPQLIFQKAYPLMDVIIANDVVHTQEGINWKFSIDPAKIYNGGAAFRILGLSFATDQLEESLIFFE